MSFRGYIMAMTIGTLVSWAAWLLVLFRVNPYEAGGAGLALFYASLLLSLLGTFALVGLAFRHRAVRTRFLVEKVVTSFRQGLWFAVVIVGSLILQSKGVLTWWNALLLVGIVTLLEFFFISAKPKTDALDSGKPGPSNQYI